MTRLKNPDALPLLLEARRFGPREGAKGLSCLFDAFDALWTEQSARYWLKTDRQVAFALLDHDRMDRAFLPEIEAAISDPDPIIRSSARAAMTHGAVNAESEAVILRQLESPDPDTRRWSALQLDDCVHPDTRTTLTAWLGRAPEGERALLEETLRRCEWSEANRRSSPLMRRGLDEKMFARALDDLDRRKTRCAAAKRLGDFGAALPLIALTIQLSETREPCVRDAADKLFQGENVRLFADGSSRTAAQLISLLGRTDLLPELERLLSHPQSDVRTMAQRAFDAQPSSAPKRAAAQRLLGSPEPDTAYLATQYLGCGDEHARLKMAALHQDPRFYGHVERRTLEQCLGSVDAGR